jgi:hypothetical protein
MAALGKDSAAGNSPLSAALAFVKMIVPLAPFAFGLFSLMSRAAC